MNCAHNLVMKIFALFVFALSFSLSAQADDNLSLGAAKPYAIIQLGDDASTSETNKLEITSNSSVFGSTLKGTESNSNENKLSTSKITGSWDRETGVSNDISSSFTGSQNTLTTPQFTSIAQDALGVSVFWASQTGVSSSINLNSSSLTLDAATIANGALGATIIDVDGDFILNSGAKLTLTGGANDFFVFNISANDLFSIQSNSIIELTGGIDAMDVLFNVLGDIEGPGPDDALIGGGSIFQGTLLATGRKVEVTQNHFFTFESGGIVDSDGGTNAPSTTEILATQAILEKEQNDSSWGGLFGQIVAGGTINFTESDISYQPFMAPVPVPAAVWLFGSGLIALLGLRRKKIL